MLEEIGFPGEADGKLIKRWFTDAYFDLYIWLDEHSDVSSFQLCYNKPNDEHALTWKLPNTYYHQQVDDGENHPGKSKSTPVLLPDGAVDAYSLADRFSRESQNIEPTVAAFVRAKVLEYSKRGAAA